MYLLQVHLEKQGWKLMSIMLSQKGILKKGNNFQKAGIKLKG